MDNESLYLGLRDNIDIFAKTMCSDVVQFDIPEFHMDLYSLITNSDRLVAAAPRGFAKSTLITKIYPLHCGLFKTKRDICIISASETLAVEHLRYIKIKVESDPVIRQYFGELKSEKWTESHIILKHPDGTLVNMRAKGAGGQIRGFRPDCVVCDDLETDDSVESEEQRKKLKNWLFKACINCLLPGGQLAIIGTVIHPLSVLSDLLDMPNDWTKRRYMAYEDGIEEEGHELWPEARPHAWLQQRKKEIGSSRFAAEFMNDPKTDEHAPIRDGHIRYWEELPNQLGLVISVDPAYSEEETADYKVASLIGVDHNYNRYLIRYIRTHCPGGEFMDSIINMFLEHKLQVTGVGVPNRGVEKEFFKSFNRRCEERGVYPPIKDISNTFSSSSGVGVRNKKSRIVSALQPLFENGKYYIHPTHVEARDEILTIGSSRWDDLVDSMASAEQIMTPQFHEMPEDDFQHSNEVVLAGSYGIEY